MLDRRSLLKGAIRVGLVGVSAPALLSAPARAQFKSDPFKLGVASGDPSPDGFVIWTRLAPEPISARGGISGDRHDVSWEVATDDQMKQIVRSGTETARQDLAFSVHVEVDGLQPTRDYFYRFRAGGAQSAVGRARTFPVAGAAIGQMKFGSAGCQKWEGEFFTAWRRISEEHFDFVFHYGDYIYENRAAASTKKYPNPPRVLPADFAKCVTLDDYRRRYGLYKSDADLQAAHASCPFLSSFDDHEVADNWAGDSDPPNTPRDAFLARRAAGFKAWYEHMPVRRALVPHGPDILAYRRLRFGTLADIDILDTRQYRSKQPCGDGVKACADADAAGRTMMGQKQESWLAAQLKGEQAIWQVLAQQVLFGSVDLRTAEETASSAKPTHPLDKWDGATAARKRVLAMLREAKVRNPVVLSGDLHRAVALEINEERSGSPRSIAVEFLATSVSSDGDGSTKPARANVIYRNNPHVKLYGNERGYCRHVVTPKRWQADFRVVEKISVAGLPVKTAKSFVVEAGKPALAEA